MTFLSDFSFIQQVCFTHSSEPTLTESSLCSGSVLGAVTMSGCGGAASGPRHKVVTRNSSQSRADIDYDLEELSSN